MPYDITDAKEEIKIIHINQQGMLDILKKKFPEEFKKDNKEDDKDGTNDQA